MENIEIFNNYLTNKSYYHYKTWLEDIQGQTEYPIDNEIIEEIKKHCNNKEITIILIKSILRKLHYNKYYENINYIYYKLTGKNLLELDKDTEEYLLKNIKEIYEIKYKFIRKGISMQFLTRKLLEEINKEKYYEYFPYVNNIEKVKSQNLIWEEISKHRTLQYNGFNFQFMILDKNGNLLNDNYFI